MYSLLQIASFEQIVKKSRFLAVAGPIDSERSAREFIAAHSDPQANHNCWAWRCGAIYRFSDDGEPSGTAGKPLLQAIDTQAMDNVALVVTRWFGGVLLGTGGLARAYGGTAANCLRLSSRVEIVATVEATLRLAFSDLSVVKAKLAGLPGVGILREEFYDGGAEITLSVAASQADRAARLVADTTSGRTMLSLDRTA